MFFHEKEKEVKISGNYDVIVAGSGPAGISAAVCAARNGAKTLLVEYFGTVGGISTTGMMSHWTGSVDSAFYREILKESAKRNVFSKEVTNYIDTEQLKLLYLDMLKDAGVTVRLYTQVCDAIVENGVVNGIITESKSGREAFLGKVIIDATGDGDVAARAGAEYYLGRESDGLMQPSTLMFKLAGVEVDRAVFPGSFETMVQTERGELQGLAKEKLPAPAGHVLLYRNVLPGIVTVNMTNATGINGTDADSLTAGEIMCRSQMHAIVDFLREYAPGYEHCYIISAASMLGVRETRHFRGMYTLNEEDVLTARHFDDWAVRGAFFNFDVHNLTGSGLDKTGIQHKWTQQNGYDIPYGCLIPEKIDGLMLAGRCISGTHLAHSNYRVMPICVGIGEAAGAAAAIAVKDDISPREVDVHKLQSVLLG